MSFAQNLQKIRKANGISQEQLAAQLNVSRQAVSKWESGNGYPEIEKLFVLCELYQCDLDTLMRGEIEFITESESDEFMLKNEYEKAYHHYALLNSLGLDFIFVGIVLFFLSANLLVIINEDIAGSLGIALLLGCIAIAVGCFSFGTNSINDFKYRYPQLPDFYDEEEIQQIRHVQNIFDVVATALILIGVAIMILLSTFFESSLPIVILLIFIAIAVHLYTYFGNMKDKVNIQRYNQKSKF